MEERARRGRAGSRRSPGRSARIQRGRPGAGVAGEADGAGAGEAGEVGGGRGVEEEHGGEAGEGQHLHRRAGAGEVVAVEGEDGAVGRERGAHAAGLARGPASGGIEPPLGRLGLVRTPVRGGRGRDAAVAATRCAQVRALFSLLVFGLLAENDCSPGFKAV